jgi:hypothetical protein
VADFAEIEHIVKDGSADQSAVSLSDSTQFGIGSQ